MFNLSAIRVLNWIECYDIMQAQFKSIRLGMLVINTYR